MSSLTQGAAEDYLLSSTLGDRAMQEEPTMNAPANPESATPEHTPSLVHLRDFVRARAKGRRTHVAQDREQVFASRDGNFFAFFYERFLSGTIEYINDGCRGSALHDVVEAAPSNKRASYEAAARGMLALLGTTAVRSARRQQRNVVVIDVDGTQMVSLRLHLILELSDGERLATHIYFPDQALTPSEISLMETSIALATQQLDNGTAPALLLARTGELRRIDLSAATTAERRAYLRTEADAYKTEWELGAEAS
ncbi:hypothetical protein C5C24_11470 [Rathayibacter sp. AY2B3]|uniref:hypothetical protein n=1 Tax=Rathayibacter sp. AY2B3 TaxID=2080569 RepID=UPI000CE841BD|nr:hypothetical protein [Rathayibacter sp. AY2B3]PPG49943.1 hypothetical protein C5C24_11470 [Rathayibacter sp. AY2B3]